MSITLDHLLSPLAEWLDDPACEEVCVNGPNDLWVYRHGEFTRYPVKLSVDDIVDLGIVAAAERGQDVDASKPILLTDLDGRGRLCAVLEPSVGKGLPSLTIRRGSDDWPTLEGLAATGLFDYAKSTREAFTPADTQLLSLYEQKAWWPFLALAVRSRKTIILCGENASGKTHLSKALINEIPLHERIITIENAPELRGLPHPNRVQLFFDDDGNGPSPTKLVAAALRMRIGRLFMQEIRSGEEMIAFLVSSQTGHAGSITTIHASHCQAAFDRMRVLIKQTPGGAAIHNDDINSQLKELVQIIIHCRGRNETPGFAVDEVMFNLPPAGPAT
jgi:type IV secretion system protein VirB11